jgi:hypothetical protein
MSQGRDGKEPEYSDAEFKMRTNKENPISVFENGGAGSSRSPVAKNRHPKK